MSLVIVISLFITSFFPLWISILFIDIKNIICSDSNLYTETISIIIIIAINLLATLNLRCWLMKEVITSEEIILNRVSENKSISAEYLLAYILPLFAFDFTRWDSAVLFLIFFSTLGFICVRHNNFSINILLELMKYNVYDCQTKIEENEKIEVERKIISKINLCEYTGRIIRIEKLNNEYCIARNEK